MYNCVHMVCTNMYVYMYVCIQVLEVPFSCTSLDRYMYHGMYVYVISICCVPYCTRVTTAFYGSM